MKRFVSILFLSFLSLIIWGQEKVVIVNKDRQNIVYQVNRVPVDTLKKVDPNIPADIINEVYQKGLKAYDSTIVACHYGFKNFWLQRTSDIRYKVAVYYEDAKEMSTELIDVSTPKSAAYEIYVLLFAIVVVFFAILMITKGYYTSEDIKNNKSSDLLSVSPLALCAAVDLIVYFSLGRNFFALFVFFALGFVLMSVIIRMLQINWTKNSYLIFQKVTLLLIIVSLGVVTGSIIFSLLIFAIFFGILSIFIPIKLKKEKVAEKNETEHKLVDEEY